MVLDCYMNLMNKNNTTLTNPEIDISGSQIKLGPEIDISGSKLIQFLHKLRVHG
jgi:hypothetical protein